MENPRQSCSVCRLLRSLSFSVLGGGVAGFGALQLGWGNDTAIIAAVFGSVAAVVWSNRGRGGFGKISH